MKQRILPLFLAGILSFCAACAKGTDIPSIRSEQEPEPVRIGVSILTSQLEYYVSLFESYKKYADEIGIELQVYDSKWDKYKQSSDIQKMIEDGVNAIICSPADPTDISDDLQDARKAGIPVIVEMTYVDDRFPLVNTNQYEGGVIAGQYAGEWILENCGGDCNVAIISYPFFQNTLQRQEGFEDGLAQTAPDARIVEIADGQAKFESSYQAMLEILEHHPDVRCVFGINDDTARGINKAFHSTRLPVEDVCVIGFDADNSTIQLIDGKDEYIKASVKADTDIIARSCIDNSLKMMNGEQIPNWIEVSDAQYIYSADLP